MVNTFLLILSVLTLIVWLIQEKFARPVIQANLKACIDKSRNVAAEDLRGEAVPQWCELAYKGVAGLWCLWIVALVMLKDGDFALVLVILTFLSAIVGGLDRYVFQAGRQAFVQTAAVMSYLTKYTKEQRDQLKGVLGGEMMIAEYCRSFFPVLAVVLVLRSFIVEPFQIPSESMVPTLEVGDYILVNKYAYGVRLPVIGTKIVETGEPQRGDVMVFYPPNDSRYFIKRVIGLPGDRISYKDKVLTINGEVAEQAFIADIPPFNLGIQRVEENLSGVKHLAHNTTRVHRGNFENYVVPDGHYFMMGDNRDNSSDSRMWGPVPEQNIVGKAFAVWMHWASFTELPSFKRVGTIQ
jgi:signal peptidase I